MNVLSTLSMFSFMLCLYLGLHVLFIDKKSKTHKIFFFMCLSLSLFTFFSILITSSEEKEMTQRLLKSSDQRSKYCQARILIEEAKLLDSQGKYLQSSKRFGEAVSNIKSINEEVVTKSEINISGVKKFSAIKGMDNLDNFEPNIYIYDNYPNGIGFSEVLYERAGEIFEKILEVINSCTCSRGCPSCVGPSIRNDGNHKKASQFIVKLLLNKVYS